MRFLITTFSAILIMLSACSPKLPPQYSEVGRFTGSIDGRHYSLVSTSTTLRYYLLDGTEEDSVVSQVDYVFKSGMHQYIIYIENGFSESGLRILPRLEIIVQSDPTAIEGAEKHLRVDSIALYNTSSYQEPDYSAQLQSGFGAIETISLQTDENGRISFEFAADLPSVAMIGDTLVPVPDGRTLRIKGRFAGQVPDWKNTAE